MGALIALLILIVVLLGLLHAVALTFELLALCVFGLALAILLGGGPSWPWRHL